MTQRRFELIALLLVIGYAILFFTARDPVCPIGSASRVSIRCAPAPKVLEPRPNGGFTVMLENAELG
jgi:hypothetical protein